MIKNINLQLFAEGAPEGIAQSASAPSASAPAASAVPPGQTAQPQSIDEQLANLFNSANATDNAPPAPNPAAAQEPHAQGGTPNPEQSLPENFKSVADLVKSFKNAQAELTRKNQAFSELSRAMEAMKADFEAKLQALTQPQTAAQAQPSAQQTDEFAGLNAEEILERFYADPVGVLTKIAERVAESKVKPIESKLNPVVQLTEQQRNLERWKEAVADFAGKYPNMHEFLDGMKEYIAENNLQDSTEPEKVLKMAYTYAKGLKDAPPPDPASLLNNPEFVNKYILANPAIKDTILKAHMQELKGTPAPPVITGSSSGMGVVAPPPARPKTIEEAGNMFESMLRGNFGR